ncbi:MAG: hypothetical protein IJR80_06685 [Treponema sp.]|nr:hypothetical protein [Treponema sp.]
MKKTYILPLAALFLLSACTTTKNIQPVNKYEGKSASQILSQMSLEEKVGQLFVIQPDQLDPAFGRKGFKYHKTFAGVLAKNQKKYQVGGIILFGGNIKDKNQLKKFNSTAQSLSNIPLLIATDEEGGRVTRLAKTKALELKNIPSMEEIGDSGDINQAFDAGVYIASYLSEYGINWDFAPVTDVNTNPENIVIGDRAFGSEPSLVSDMAGAFLDGLHENGVKGCIKHFPGHGDTKDDTHDDFVAVYKDWNQLKACELIPFTENFAKADSVMIAHVTVNNVTGDGLPASLSKELVTGKLRRELGYKGLILTDSLGMGAIKKHYSPGDAAVMAFNAGNDIILMPAEFFKAYDGVLKAVKNGRITQKRLDESVLRILKFKGFMYD